MRMEDGELVAVVLEEPELGAHVELEAVRRRGGVPAALVSLGDAVLEDDQPACFVRLFLARMLHHRPAHGGGHLYHQSVRSIDVATSSALQKSALRYFQPASASTQTTTPSSSSAASLTATCTTAPAETPAKDSLGVQQRADGGDRLLVRHEHLPVELRDVEDRRHVAVLQRAQSHHGVTGQRLCRRDDGRRGSSPAAARRCPSTCRRCRGLRRARRRGRAPRRSRARTLVVSPRIRRVRVLEGHEVTRFAFSELERKPHCAVRPLVARRVDDLCAVEAQQAGAVPRLRCRASRR